MDAFAAGQVFQHEETRAVAVFTSLGGVRRWFVFDLEQGGQYADGTFDDVVTGDGWHALEEVAAVDG
jgi:hypothetical protein